MHPSFPTVFSFNFLTLAIVRGPERLPNVIRSPSILHPNVAAQRGDVASPVMWLHRPTVVTSAAL